MIMPGSGAKEFRIMACNILRRYMAGDESLVSEIRANAASTAPINQLARESLASESSSETCAPKEMIVRPVMQFKPVVKKARFVEIVDSVCLKPRVALTKEERLRLWDCYYPPGSVSAKCILCGTRPVYLHACGFEAAHVRARSKGGVDELWNLVPVCSGCNNAMGAVHALKWVATLGHQVIASVSGNAHGNPILPHGPNGLIDRIINTMFSIYLQDNDSEHAFAHFKMSAHIPKSAISSLCMGAQYTATFSFLSAEMIEDLNNSN
jgi:hypothetical protein